MRSLRLPLVAFGALCLPAVVAAAVVPTVVINEINYAPDSGALIPALRFEYVELYNATDSGVDLSSLTLLGGAGTLDALPALVLPAHAFLVVYGSGADGVLAEDTDLTDGTGRIVASSEWDDAGELGDGGDAVELYSSVTGEKDFVDYDELNTGDFIRDLAAVSAGIWKSGAAIDTPLAAVTGRALALRVDGAAPNEVAPAADAEDLDWMSYEGPIGGTPGRWNDPDTLFRNGFEGTSLFFWSDVVGAS